MKQSDAAILGFGLIILQLQNDIIDFQTEIGYLTDSAFNLVNSNSLTYWTYVYYLLSNQPFLYFEDSFLTLHCNEPTTN